MGHLQTLSRILSQKLNENPRRKTPIKKVSDPTIPPLGPAGEYTSQGWMGVLYPIHGSRQTSHIARMINDNINEAIERGDLPPIEWKTKTRLFAGGSSIDITITDIGSVPMFLPNTGKTDLVFSKEAERIRNGVKSIAQQYRRDESNPQIDYFSNNFYLNVEFDSSLVNLQKKMASGKIKPGEADEKLRLRAHVKAAKYVLKEIAETRSIQFPEFDNFLDAIEETLDGKRSIKDTQKISTEIRKAKKQSVSKAMSNAEFEDRFIATRLLEMMKVLVTAAPIGRQPFTSIEEQVRYDLASLLASIKKANYQQIQEQLSASIDERISREAAK